MTLVFCSFQRIASRAEEAIPNVVYGDRDVQEGDRDGDGIDLACFDEEAGEDENDEGQDDEEEDYADDKAEAASPTTTVTPPIVIDTTVTTPPVCM